MCDEIRELVEIESPSRNVDQIVKELRRQEPVIDQRFVPWETLEEYQRMPENDAWRDELVRGRIVREPRPGARHGVVLEALFRSLAARIPPSRGRVLFESGFLLRVDPPTVRGPDLAFISAGRISPEGIPEGYWTIAPDLAIEVVSPSNTTGEMLEKVMEYLDAATRLVWVVDPRTRTVAAYRSRSEIRLLAEEDTLDGADVLPELSIPVADLFAGLD